MFVSHSHHNGISKCEWLLQREAGRGWFWDKRKHVHHMATYGTPGHFGGWIFERHSPMRQRYQRTWRKRARREAKRWLQEISE